MSAVGVAKPVSAGGSATAAGVEVVRLVIGPVLLALVNGGVRR
ncbi:hypothetical protein QRX50_41625 [Amycolatopsis carbonis]|uniref:Uncharacterized protein n=1 Tax=Amycolatopsis carbonis TaxID=715471 RepID=A0A9Y2IEV7_9PSEU|nr:hypothetical protein [Amycolatopsis sp. 2-15]WIX77835.1 hypothetical protein QRX50_41625 [Amycolatopsis sp. 2-15]